MASASTPSANELVKYLILVHTVWLKPMIKAQISARMVSNGISVLATASVHSEKTRLKKVMMKMIFESEPSSIFYYLKLNSGTGH